MYFSRDYLVDQDKKNFERISEEGNSEDSTGQAKSQVGLRDHEQAESNQQMQLLVPGSIIAERYKVLFLIGRGAMGSVYRIEQLALRKKLALKTLNTIATSDVNIRRFQNR